MRPIKIMTDSCADFPKGYVEENNIAVINFSIFMNGVELYVEPNWISISAANLYDSLRQGTRIWTLPATHSEIRTKMRSVLDEGFDIIYISTSEKQSTTYTKATRIAGALRKEYEEAKIVVIDSKNASVGIALCVMHAVNLLNEGKDIDEIASKVRKIRKNVLEFVTPETLTYLSKANKINARSASLGNLLGIKPILISDADGNQASLTTVKGKEKSYETIVKLFLENVIEPENQVCYIIHGDNLPLAKQIKDRIVQSGVEFKDYEFICMGAVVGITVGPGSVGLFGIGKEVTTLTQ